jgi:RHH-type proline utilization regulon transcriptional repressor/proline dehydrogenase/delta 1-pyrroline-5-carboxylate dehydrogenase
VPPTGLFVSPTVIKLDGIEELKEEIFGPVLHVATFEASELDQVVDTINAQGYGLTFGLHTRVDTRVERIIERIKAGNIYVNRNQIGAIVGSQPFGGEGLSGTGPKAGGPHYVRRFMKADSSAGIRVEKPAAIDVARLQQAIDQVDPTAWAASSERLAQLQRTLGSGEKLPEALDSNPEEMPGPTGELNRLSCCPRGVILCLGPDLASALAQARLALSQGNGAVVVAPGAEALTEAAANEGVPIASIDGLLNPGALKSAQGFEAVASAADESSLRSYRVALSQREGALLPLITELNVPERFVIERHLCIDTTAAGGNASLIAASE